MLEYTFQSQTESDNPEITKNILSICNHLKIFAFYGDLGAGKTTLIKSFCSFLGVVEPVTSPTFTLVNEYSSLTASIYHFDFYRIRSETEAYDIGVEEYFDSGSYIFIEWPEKIPTLLPAEAAQIHIFIAENNRRVIRLIC
ncbi:MAG: tRNA (adenosine(37)-N6)-threonylcarbamoyltransferase complex ATPase subunit type 1 TsaE [Bacteroidia bacterium]|nr:tRNA (adenosine(37)-N6)-threonylcarbamoyltransferase complex ATPase subunit type 1 TsaE [Bacteroidia bacterium]